MNLSRPDTDPWGGGTQTIQAADRVEKKPSSLKSSNEGIGSHLTKSGNVNQKCLTYKTHNRRENVVSFSGRNERDNDIIN